MAATSDNDFSNAIEDKKNIMVNNSEWDNASAFSKWTFKVADKMLSVGMTKSLQFDDLMVISTHDYSAPLMQDLKLNYDRCGRMWFVPKLMVAMFRSHWWEFTIVTFYTLLESAVRIALPVILRLFLNSLGNPTSTREDNFIWAVILSGLGIAQLVVHHVLFFYSMRLGWNWKTSITGLIYDRLFLLSSSALATHSTGKLVNLISNDVARFEEFSIFAAFFLGINPGIVDNIDNINLST